MIENTFFPIVLGMLIGIGTIIIRGIPKYNKEALIKSTIILSTGLFFFIKGLDDANDYLRIYHSIWHFCGSTVAYYM